MNDNQIFSLFVTDYTRNPLAHLVQAKWCPPQLSERVLKIELFGRASEEGPNMKIGEYYHIRNVRMKMGAGGYLEATFSESWKMRRLNEHEADGEPHFQALLQ